MSRDRKGPKRCPSCAQALTLIARLQRNDIVDLHSRIAKMITEPAVCTACGTDFRLTMRPQGSVTVPEHPHFLTCDEGLNDVLMHVHEHVRADGCHIPAEAECYTVFAWCVPCAMHIKLTVTTR